MLEGAIYISYARSNKYLAEHLQLELTRAGITTFYDKNLLKIGQDLFSTLRNGIDRATVLVVLISESSAQSEFVKDEVQYARDNGKTIVPLLLDKNTLLLQSFDLLQIYTPVIETPSDLQAVIKDLILLLQPGLNQVVNELYERRYEEPFVRMLSDLVTTPRDNALVIHYQSKLTLGTALRIEQALNEIAWILLSATDDIGDLALLVERRQNILQISSFTHPASTQLLVDLSNAAAALIASPDFAAFVIGFITSVTYDITKTGFLNTVHRIFGARKNPHDDRWEMIESEQVQTTIIPITSRLQENVEVITNNERYIGFRSGRIVWGTENRTTERRLLEG